MIIERRNDASDREKFAVLIGTDRLRRIVTTVAKILPSVMSVQVVRFVRTT